MAEFLRSFLNILKGPTIDLFWPRLTGPREKQPCHPDSLHPNHLIYINDLERHVLILSAIREERSRTVDRKLLALLTLTAVFSAALTASLVAATTLGSSSWPGTLIVAFPTSVIIYIVIQLYCSLRATLNGLIRRDYQVMPLEALTPIEGESKDMYRTRLLNIQINSMHQHEWAVNQKVSQMAVAHRALKNALAGAGLLACLAVAVVVFQLT